MSEDIGILVVAQGIDNEVRDRFQKHLKSVPTPLTHKLLIMGDTNINGDFFKTKLLNSGIKELFKHNHKIIIQTDIDLIIPPNIIDDAYKSSLSGKNCFHSCMRRLNISEIEGLEYKDYPWKLWKTYKKIYASGCWNAATPEAFQRIGLWNELMFGWGEEDSDFRTRGIAKGIQWTDVYNYPLMHIDHPTRNRNNKKYNKEVARKCFEEGKTNWM